ncbi:MAG TPA: hypothetical protein VGH87_19300 [Polyangiaceae bacterium]
MDQLVACRACAVHVRMNETRCPFCGAAAPSRSLEAGPRARTSRAALQRFHAAAIATCAIACDHGQSGATVTIAPAASSTPAATATASANRGEGERCASNGDCAAGLNCCTTDVGGACGGRARRPSAESVPCVVVQTCVARECTPLPMPPYGAAFPDDESAIV